MFEGFQFRQSQYLYLLALLVPLGLLCYWLIEQRRQQLLALMGNQVELRAVRVVKYYRLRAVLILLAVGCGLIALARPQWGAYQTIVQSKGVDVIIAVDVSLSMLATDEAPSRIARARLLSADLIERLKDNRIGLIAFAGSSAGVVPLTLDNAALKTFVDALNGRTIENQGTSIVNAIQRATQSFKTIGKQSRVLIIISDGEDQNEDPIASVREAAQEAANNSIIILTIGVGSAKGSNIPLQAIGAAGLKMDGEGNPVVTQLDEALLQTAAETTGGIYLHAQPDSSEAAVITSFIDKLNKGELSDRLMRDRAERYQYPLTIALILLITDIFLLCYRPTAIN